MKMDSSSNCQQSFYYRLLVKCLLLGLATTLIGVMGCGELTDSNLDAKDEGLSAFGVPIPDPGPRFFPAPTDEFFDDSRISTLNPDPEERLPMVLAENVYWLADEHAASVTAYGFEELQFPLDGNEAMLGYEPGHILLNRYTMIRHYVEDISVRGDVIVMKTRLAEVEELMVYGNLFFEMEPDTPYPYGFDIIDPYLFPDREAQLEVFERKRVEFEQMRQRQEATRTRQQSLSNACFDLLYGHPTVTHDPDRTFKKVEEWQTHYDKASYPMGFAKKLVEDEGEQAIFSCNEIVVEMHTNYFKTSRPAGQTNDPNADDDSLCGKNLPGGLGGTKSYSGKCPCAYHLSPSQCAEIVCVDKNKLDVDICGEHTDVEVGEKGPDAYMNEGPPPGIGISFSHCVNTRTNDITGERCPLCPDWGGRFNPVKYPDMKEVMNVPWDGMYGEPIEGAKPLPFFLNFCDPDAGLKRFKKIGDEIKKAQAVGNLDAELVTEAVVEIISNIITATDSNLLAYFLPTIEHIGSAVATVVEFYIAIKHVIDEWANMDTATKVAEVINLLVGLFKVGYSIGLLGVHIYEMVQDSAFTDGMKEAFEEDMGAIPSGIPFIDWWPPMTCNCLPVIPIGKAVLRVGLDIQTGAPKNTPSYDSGYTTDGISEDGDGPDSTELNNQAAGVEFKFGQWEDRPIQLGPDIFNLTLRPIYMFTIGVRFGLKFFWLGAEFYVGAYTGLGFGINAELNIAQLSGSVEDSRIVYFSQLFGNGIDFMLWIIPLTLDPYFRMDFHGRGNIGGQNIYDYYKEFWAFFCLKVSTSSGITTKAGGMKVEDGVVKKEGGGWQAAELCGLPYPERVMDYDGFLDKGMSAQATVTIMVGLGVELRIQKTPPGNGIYFEPIKVFAHLDVTLRRPYCNWSLMMGFGGEFGVRIKLPVLGRKDFGVSWQYPFLNFQQPIGGPIPNPDNPVPILDDLLRFIFGCGEFEAVEPYSGERIDCPVGKEGDDQCTDRFKDDYGDDKGRCFARQCVRHDHMRVSLGWTSPDVDLDLNVMRVGNGSQSWFAAAHFDKDGSAANGVFTSHATGTEEEAGGRFIENFILSNPPWGTYEFWATVKNKGANTPQHDIPFTIEVEVEDAEIETRQLFEGMTNASFNNQTGSKRVSVFELCMPQSDEEFCAVNGLCGLSSGYDNCGTYREDVECGVCSMCGWQQGGLLSAGKWWVDECPDGEYIHSVFQSINQSPTTYVSNQEFINVEMTGQFRVHSTESLTASLNQPGSRFTDDLAVVSSDPSKILITENWNDDDFIGFVFGVKSPTSPSSSTEWDALVFSWKQVPQNGASEGMVLGYAKGLNAVKWNLADTDAFRVIDTSYVNVPSGESRPFTPGKNYAPNRIGSSVVSSGAGGSCPYSICRGWEYDKTYDFRLVYTTTRVQIFIDGHVVFDVDNVQAGFPDGFPEGYFGFYNYSQPNVEYFNFEPFPLD